MNTKRYTNLQEFQDKIKIKFGYNDDSFEFLTSQIYQPEQIKDEEFDLIREEDELIEALQLNLRKAFENLIPKQGKKEWMNNAESSEKMFKCKKHPNRSCTYVCVNSSCPYGFFCQSCSKAHQKECNRNIMYMNSDQIINREFVHEYFDPSSFDYEQQIRAVRELVDEKRKKINMNFDVLEKIMVNKIKFQSKEFKLKQLKACLDNVFEEYEGNLLVCICIYMGVSLMVWFERE